ncbi:hypothetical protein [Bradyrhizobium sp. CCGUVB14]|nr:hypothetical protein [Bradyrhizobium sp. CCGUVB14]MCP3441090.1 hypothetical protein [Bradyrhizobium sp. CCGUVB14]
MLNSFRCLQHTLVDEHEARRFKLGLLGLQLGARGSDIGAILFSGVQSFF